MSKPEELDQKKKKIQLTVISGGREDLRLLGRNDSVTGDELGENTSSSLDTCRGWIEKSISMEFKVETRRK